jgi:hypothetical protein
VAVTAGRAMSLAHEEAMSSARAEMKSTSPREVAAAGADGVLGNLVTAAGRWRRRKCQTPRIQLLRHPDGCQSGQINY